MKSLLLLPFLCLISCDNSTYTTAPDTTNTESNNKITADELLRAMGGYSFEVTLPDDLQPTQQVGLALKHSDGSINSFGGMSYLKAGEKVRVVVFQGGDDLTKYSILGSEGTTTTGLNGSFPSKLVEAHTSRSTMTTEKAIQAEECLIRYSKNECNIKEALGHDQLDLILHIANKNGE